MAIMKFKHYTMVGNDQGNWSVFVGQSYEECHEAEEAGRVYMIVSGDLVADEVHHYVALGGDLVEP